MASAAFSSCPRSFGGARRINLPEAVPRWRGVETAQSYRALLCLQRFGQVLASWLIGRQALPLCQASNGTTALVLRLVNFVFFLAWALTISTSEAWTRYGIRK